MLNHWVMTSKAVMHGGRQAKYWLLKDMWHAGCGGEDTWVARIILNFGPHDSHKMFALIHYIRVSLPYEKGK